MALVCNWQTRWEQGLSSGRQAFVVMVQSADFGEREDLTFPWELNPSVFWSSFVQPQMSSPAMIICEITLPWTIHVSSAQYDHVVRTFTAQRTDESFHIR